MKRYFAVILPFLFLLPFSASATYIVQQGGTGVMTLPPGAMLQGNGQSPITGTYNPIVGNITATDTAATTTLQKTSISGAISLLGEYFTNFTNYVRSLFSNGTGLNYSAGQFSLQVPVVVANGGTGQTSLAPSQLLYGNGTAPLSSVATSSVNSGTGISLTGTPGALVGGTNLTITNTGVTSITAAGGLIASAATGAVTLTGRISTSTVPNIGGLPYWTGNGTPSTLGTVATTSVTCSGIVTCSSFTAIGTSPITLTGTGNTGTISTSTPLVSGQVDFSTGVNTIGNDSNFTWDNTRKFLGFSTSTPYGQISINPTAVNGNAPSLVIGSSTGTSFVVANNGDVGIGTTSPYKTLSVTGSMVINGPATNSSTAPGQLVIQSDGTVNQNEFIDFDNSSGNLLNRIVSVSNGDLNFQGVGATPHVAFTNAGNVGIGTTSPSQILTLGGSAGEVTTGNRQFLINSMGRASQVLNGDWGNSAGEPGGEYTQFIQDGGLTKGLIGITQTAGFDPAGDPVTGATSNDFMISASSTMNLDLAAGGTVGLTVQGNSATICGVVTHTYIGSPANVGGDMCPAFMIDQLDQNGNAIMRLGGPGAAWAGELLANAGVVTIGTKTSVPIGLNIVGQRVLTINSTLNSGFGTTTPWGELSASSTSAFPALVIEQHGAGAAAIFLGGNFGIGTTSPVSLLSIQGSGYISGNSFFGGAITATSTFQMTARAAPAGAFAAFDTNGFLIATTAPSTGAGGLNAQVQYNNAGSLAGISGATTNGTIMSLTNPLLGGATLTTSSVNGVTLTTGGAATSYLNASGAYSVPAGGVTSIATNNGITGGTITTTGTIGLATINAGVLGAVTNGSIPTSLATSTLFGLGTNGTILAEVGGIPTWTATTTFSSGLTYLNGNVTNTGLLSLQQTGGGLAQTGAITFATSSASFNGLTIGSNITNIGGAFTFTPTVTGTLGNAGLTNSSLTVTASSPLTGGGSVSLGGSTSLGCQTASGSQAGCLSAADWTTFNAKGVGTVTSIGLSDTNSTLTIGSSPVTGSGTITATLNLANVNTWTGLQQFNGNASSTQFTSTGNTYLATLGGAVGIGTTSPSQALSVQGNELLSGNLTVGGNGNFSNTVTKTFFGGLTNQFTISATGEVVGFDLQTGQQGQYSPMRYLSFKLGTSTAWTGTSTVSSFYGDTAQVVMPFAGVIRTLACSNSAGTLEVQFTVNSVSGYYPASTTAGTYTYTNTFTKGQVMTVIGGNPGSAPTYSTCTIGAMQTP